MKRIPSIPRKIDLTGMFLPVYVDQSGPVVVIIEGTYFIPVFSSVEKLEEQLPIIKPHGQTKVMRITDGMDFFSSVISHVRIMLDPYSVDGNTRWTEVAVCDGGK